MRLVVLAFAGLTVLTGCFTTSADFKSDAEDYIRDDVAPALEAEFTSVVCDEPPTQNVGTTFTCTATDASGGVWEFENSIDGKNQYTVDVTRQPSSP
jgi:hypothetical protein